MELSDSVKKYKPTFTSPDSYSQYTHVSTAKVDAVIVNAIIVNITDMAASFLLAIFSYEKVL